MTARLASNFCNASGGLIRCTLGFIVAFALIGCRAEGEQASTFARSETLYIGGPQWGEPSTFNPLSSSADWPLRNCDLLYESLLQYDSQTGKIVPMLAESYQVGSESIEVVLNPAAHFNDGQPVTGWDVKYTYDLAKRYQTVPGSPTWQYLTEVKLLDPDAKPYPRRLAFLFDMRRKNPLVVLDGLTNTNLTRILPRHVVEPLLTAAHDDMLEFEKLKFDRGPIGSGPYKLLSYSSEKIVVVRDDHYWGNQALHQGKLPAPKYIVHPIYKGNDHFSMALQQGRLDASSSFVPRIWLKQRKGVRSWYDQSPFFVPASIPTLFLNVTHLPLGDVRMRRAMAFAVNYRDIRELAFSGYSEPLKPGLILPFGVESKYFSEEDATRYGAFYDPAQSRALLAEGGYVPVFGPDGQLVETRDRSGARLPTVYIKSPTGWTDYESIVRIVVKNLREVGIDARERFIDAALYWPALYAADFDAIMNLPIPEASPSKPWSRMEWVLTSKEWAPEGEKMYKNFGRFNNPKAPDYDPRIEELIDLIPTFDDESRRVAAYRELNVRFMKAQPVIPLVYRPDAFYEFSIRHWRGFPNAADPFTPPQIPGERLGTQMLWRLEPVLTN
jgi:peptide/nickel transport system substrate-binding protein